MYSEFYKLNGSPFRLNPDHRFFYVAEPHQKAIAHLQYALSRSEGFVVITGEVGAGKTTLVNRMLSELEASSYITGNIVTSFVEHADLIHLVASTFGVSRAGADKATLLLNIRAFLEEQRMLGRHPILFVDEVQNLPESSLEELRMLSNFSLPGESLLQIFLVGQPEFRETLADETMEQLRQRVVTACHLGTLDAEDTRNYVAHRLRLANWQGDPAFSARSFELIHILSRGVPRRINQICDRLLLYGFLEQIHRIDATVVAAVARDMTDEGLITAPASVLNAQEDDEVDAEMTPAEAAEEAAEPEFSDTPLPEEFLEELGSFDSIADFLSGTHNEAREVSGPEADGDPDVEALDPAPESAADTGLSSLEPIDETPDEILVEAEPEPALVKIPDAADLSASGDEVSEVEAESATGPEPEAANQTETDSKLRLDADSEPDAEPEENLEAEPDTEEEAVTASNAEDEGEQDAVRAGDAAFEPDEKPEADEEQTAAVSSMPAPAVVSLPLHLPDEALADGPTEGRTRAPRRWHLAAGAALAASILAALFALPEDWVRQHMIESDELVVSQDLDLRTLTLGDQQLVRANRPGTPAAVSGEGGVTTAGGTGGETEKKGGYVIPASTGLDGGAAVAKKAPGAQGVKPAGTTLVAALPQPKVASKATSDALPKPAPSEMLPVEERFLIQLATLRTQDEAAQLRDSFEERFNDLLADFGLGVRHANIAGAQYFRVMTELSGARERMFDICTRIKSEDQSCILVLDRASQAQAVN